jgi:hypothetical protein
MFGWVVVLRGGQRLYLEMEVTGVERQSADLEITPLLAAQQEYPDELDAVPWYWPCHINQHLGLAGALH